MWYCETSTRLSVHHVLLFLISKPSSSSPKRICVDHYKHGSRKSGNYTILDWKGRNRTVYCDMESEPGSAWVLVISFSRENKDMSAFLSTPLHTRDPINQFDQNWSFFRLGTGMITQFKNESTHWRITCSFPQYGVNTSKDYVRAAFTDFDLMSDFWEECKKVSHISVMGQSCSECTAQWSQRNNATPHIAAVQDDLCDIKSDKSGYNYFGSYSIYNPKFRCTESPTSTTNYWFGSYV